MADYDINYDDQRFKDVEADKKSAISENEKLYSGMIKDSDGYYQAQIDAAKQWEKQQTQLQNEQTDFAIEKIEQQKTQAKKDYTKEQSGAYVDWQKQSNEYGANAEKEASMGMSNTGYSESSQVSMYNTYQNRVMTARESYNNAVLNYNNAIKDARLQNNATLAEIAYKALQQQLELSLQGFQYKNQLLLDKAKQKIELDQIYHERWQDVLGQINTENALAEEIRQFNAQLAEEQRQFNYHNKLGEFAVASSGGGSSSSKRYSYTPKKTDDSNSSNDNSKINKSESNSSSSEPALDLKSVISSGLGPSSGERVAKAAKSGKVNLTVKGNTAYVSKPTTFNSAALNPELWLKRNN